MLERIKNEPAMVFSLIEAGIAIAVSFGLDLTPEQTGALFAFIAILSGVAVRSKVTPV